jgi:predicted unusual protein kinase regulating ubiquinone biosynthesis (AarF/ABC1/UbiB family)
MTANTLAVFIDHLRDRLERGELAGHPPIRLDQGRTLVNVEQSVRAMLAEVDRYRAMTPVLRDEAWNARRRRRLAEDLRRLAQQLQ